MPFFRPESTIKDLFILKYSYDTDLLCHTVHLDTRNGLVFDSFVRVLGLYLYSKTSNNGPSEKRTTSVQRTNHLPPVDFTIELIHFEPPRSGHLSTPNNGH